MLCKASIGKPIILDDIKGEMQGKEAMGLTLRMSLIFVKVLSEVQHLKTIKASFGFSDEERDVFFTVGEFVGACHERSS
jgi:hypothetical protein